MEQAIVSELRTCRGQAMITVTGVADRTAALAAVFRVLAGNGVEPGIVGGGARLGFTVPVADADRAVAALLAARARIGFVWATVAGEVALVTLAGAGLRGDPLVVATFCESLALSGVRLELVAIESGRLVAACPDNQLRAAVAGLCEAFEIRPADPVPAIGAFQP